MLGSSRLSAFLFPLLTVGAAIVLPSCKDSHALGSACKMTSECDYGLVCDIYGDKTCHHLGDTKPEPDVDAAPRPPLQDGASAASDSKPDSKDEGGSTSGDDAPANDDGESGDASTDKKTESGSDDAPTVDATAPGDGAAADAATPLDAATTVDAAAIDARDGANAAD